MTRKFRSRLEKYDESQIKSDKSDKTFETLDAKGRKSFTEQGKGGNFLGSIAEAKDEVREDGETTNRSATQKVREQMMHCMRSVLSLRDFTWDPKLNEQYGLLKKNDTKFL